MEVLQLELETKNNLVNQYISHKDRSFFHYNFSIEDTFPRYEELMRRNFPRKQLANHIREYMKKFSYTKQIEESLKKLEDEESVVVIGGQQAGLLTGPLYSIHKIFSIIVESRQKEQILNKPVVPIFWIAGEDHDIQEVNHVYKLNNDILEKHTFKQGLTSNKQMVSNIHLNKENLQKWSNEIIASFGETDFSNSLLKLIEKAIELTNTYTEFFSYIINELFGKYGLLLIDSAHPELREIESTYFQTMIENGERITASLLLQQKKLADMGYPNTIESGEHAFQLFYELRGERILLQYNREHDLIVGKGVSFTRQELLQIAKESPEKLSNNVVTRPIMQELLIPTISFIAGPGEISYWAELKGCFEILGLQIPPIVPRINITYLERNIESLLHELELSLQHVLKSGCREEKIQKFESLKDHELTKLIGNSRMNIEKQYEELGSKIVNFDKGLESIVKKNSQFVLSQLDYLSKKIDESVNQKHSILLNKYNRVEESLHPFGGYQERCWNVFYYLNHYGLEFIDQLLEFPFESNGNHYVVKL